MPVPAATRQATSSSPGVSSSSVMAAVATSDRSPSSVPARWPPAAQLATSRAARSNGATRAEAASSSRGASLTGGSLGGPLLLLLSAPLSRARDLVSTVPGAVVFASPVAVGGAGSPLPRWASRREVATPAPYDV